jgi:uncharacterized protein (DUF305 family)
MKIEFDKKTGASILIIALVFFGIGYAMNNRDDHDGIMGWMHSGSNTNSAYSANDIMFAQMMIPHHQQAIVMSDLALKTSTNPDVLELAQQIKAAQAPEIEQMKGWLRAAGTSLMGAHGMAMDGMLSDSEIATLKGSTGSTFDKLFLQGMIGHHEGALTMVSMIRNSENAEARKLAQDIQLSQSAEIDLMKIYLKNLS